MQDTAAARAQGLNSPQSTVDSSQEQNNYQYSG